MRKLLFLILALIPLACRDLVSDGGNGSETTNGISGVIKNQDGSLAKGVQVILISDTLDPVKASDQISKWTVLSNEDGEYQFNEVPPGTYNLEFLDSANANKLLIQSIAVEKGKNVSISIDSGVLEPAGELAIPVAKINEAKGGYLYIPGTSIYAAVNNSDDVNGIIIFKDVPPSVVEEVKYISEDSTFVQEVLDFSIEIKPNQNVVIDTTIWWEGFNDSIINPNWKIVDQGLINAPSHWYLSKKKLCQNGNIHGPGEFSNIERVGTYMYWSPDSALNWKDYSIRINFMTTDNDGVGLMFRYRDSLNYYKLDIDADTLKNRGFSTIFKMANGVESILAASTSIYTVGEQTSIFLEVKDSLITTKLNGELLFEGPVVDSDLSSGTIALYSWASQTVCFDDLMLTLFE